MLGAWPRVAEVDEQPLDFVLGFYDLVELLDVVVDEQKVADLIGGLARLFKQLYDSTPAHAEHIYFDVERDDVPLGIFQRELSGKAALAAADLKIERLLLCKSRAPAARVLLRIPDEKVADAELGLSPFFLSYPHNTSYKKQ